jgi:cytoskeletal protein RodZ
MSSGPSKEELEMYWKTSRSYFDELAKYYKNSDPAYYNKFIAPYYSNPFIASGNRKSSGSSAISIIAAVVVLFIGIAAAAIFYFVAAENEPVEKTPKIEKKAGEEIEKRELDTVSAPQKKVEPKKNDNRKKRIERIR